MQVLGGAERPPKCRREEGRCKEAPSGYPGAEGGAQPAPHSSSEESDQSPVFSTTAGGVRRALSRLAPLRRNRMARADSR